MLCLSLVRAIVNMVRVLLKVNRVMCPNCAVLHRMPALDTMSLTQLNRSLSDDAYLVANPTAAAVMSLIDHLDSVA